MENIFHKLRFHFIYYINYLVVYKLGECNASLSELITNFQLTMLVWKYTHEKQQASLVPTHHLRLAYWFVESQTVLLCQLTSWFRAAVPVQLLSSLACLGSGGSAALHF